jgi:polyisoprenoid-binding protein YceI
MTGNPRSNDPGERLADGTLARGRWRVDPSRTRLVLDTQVLGMVGVSGRFPHVSGHLDVAADPAASRIDVAVRAASLTSGSARLDALLAASGLVDPGAGPVIRYRSGPLVASCGTPLRCVDGVLATARGERSVRLTLAAAVATGAGFRLHVRGRIGRDTITELLSRPGAARLLGPEARLDLAVTLTPPAAGRRPALAVAGAA